MKRLFDIFVAGISLLLLWPLLLVIALLVRRQMGSPILFRQVRPGLYGRPFELVKFRSMRPPKEGCQPAADAERLTRFGRFLRASSVDELPELWNVLRGDMSLVGPRPLLMEYLPLYTPDQARRHEVRPGLTGWAQVNGRNALEWDDKFALDLWYVENHNLWIDMKILWMTLIAVAKRRGIDDHSGTGQVRFSGSAKGQE